MKSWPQRSSTGSCTAATSSTSAGNSFRMRQHTDLWKALHPTPEAEEPSVKSHRKRKELAAT
jgi:hypothetical protein